MIIDAGHSFSSFLPWQLQGHEEKATTYSIMASP